MVKSVWSKLRFLWVSSDGGGREAIGIRCLRKGTEWEFKGTKVELWTRLILK